MSSKRPSDKAMDIDLSPAALSRKRVVGNFDSGLIAPRGAIAGQFAESESPLAKENRKLKDQVDALTVTTIEWRDKNEKIEVERDALTSRLVEFDGANIAKLISPKLISASRWANRDEASFRTQAYYDLRSEIEAAGGNVQAVKVRPIAGSSPQAYEIVFGHRRHRACLDLNLDVLAVIEALDDRGLFVEMDRENRQRADLRPYEQGVMYNRALELKLYPSNKKLAEELGVDVGGVGKLLALARLPVDVLNAFDSPLDIKFDWGPVLANVLAKNPDFVLAKARELAVLQPRLKASAVFKALTSDALGVESLYPQLAEGLTVNGKSGGIATITFNPKKKAFAVNIIGIAPERSESLKQLLKSFLDS